MGLNFFINYFKLCVGVCLNECLCTSTTKLSLAVLGPAAQLLRALTPAAEAKVSGFLELDYTCLRCYRWVLGSEHGSCGTAASALTCRAQSISPAPTNRFLLVPFQVVKTKTKTKNQTYFISQDLYTALSGICE